MVNFLLDQFVKKLAHVGQQCIVTLHLIIGYLKIKSQKVRFLNTFEAKKRGVRLNSSEIHSEVMSYRDGVSCYVESVASKPNSTKDKLSVLRLPSPLKDLHKRASSNMGCK